jgi:hypothetical protein
MSAPVTMEQRYDATAGDNTISSIELYCNQTANITGFDLISLEIDYIPVWGPHPINATQVVSFNKVIPLHYNARIEFFVHSANGSKISLGSRSALAIGKKPLKFKRYGAEYTLTYKIGASE